MKDKRWSNFSVARDETRGRVAQQRAQSVRRAMADLQRELALSAPAQPTGARPVYTLDDAVTDLGLSAKQERKARDLVSSVVADTRSMFGVSKAALGMGLNKYQTAEMLRRAVEMKRQMDVRKASPVAPHGADRPDPGKKPPSGFTPIQGSTKGGYHRKTTDGSGGYDYWYPGVGIVSSPHDEDHGDVHEAHEKSKPKPEVVEASKKLHALAKQHGMSLDFHPHGGTTMEDVQKIKEHVEHGIDRAANDAKLKDGTLPSFQEDADNEGADTDTDTDTDEDEFEDDDPTEEVPSDALSGEEGSRDFGPSDEEGTDADPDEEDADDIDLDDEDYEDDDIDLDDEDYEDDDFDFDPDDMEVPTDASELAHLRQKIGQLQAALDQVTDVMDKRHRETEKYLRRMGGHIERNPTPAGVAWLFGQIFGFLNLAIPTALGAAIGGPAGAVLGAAYGARTNKRNQYRVKGGGDSSVGATLSRALSRFDRATNIPRPRTDRIYAKGGVYYDPHTDRLVVATADSDLFKAGDSYKVPEGARGNARKVLEWKRQHGSEVKGMTSVGWARARQLASQTHVGMDTVKRMSAFNRHRSNAKVDPKYASEPWKDRGYVAWLGWGGSTGVDWARRITGALDKADNDPKKTPAKPHERRTGSSRNKPGSAATASGGVELSAATIETLKGKVKSHNESSSKKVTLGQLKSVYRRGSGAFSTSHHPNANRHSWSMGRVNSFLRRVKGGDGHSQDDDLISKAGPYIGPRGGKWADPQHKIPWDEEGGDKQGVHREISRDKAAAAIIDGIPNNVRAGWLRNADRAYKPKIEQAIVSNPELHNATLNILHQQYQIGTGKKVSFEEFLDTPIKLYRAGKTPATEAFSSYSYDKDMADGFSKQYGVETHSITIKPRDTYGMINEMAEGEVLVPLKSEHSDKFQQGEALTIRGHKWNVVKRAGRQVHLQRADKPDSKPTVMAEDRLARHLSKSRRRPAPPQVLAKARAVREVQRASRARRPKNEHGHRDGLTPGDTLALRKSHATADNPDHVIVRAGGEFQWGDTIYPNARRLLADVTGNPNHHLTARRYFRLED